jgi:hypothetical protein
LIFLQLMQHHKGKHPPLLLNLYFLKNFSRNLRGWEAAYDTQVIRQCKKSFEKVQILMNSDFSTQRK